MKVKFKPGPKASASFAGFDGLKRTCIAYKKVSVSGAGQARQQRRCADYRKGAGSPTCKGGVKGRSPGLLRKSTKGCARPSKKRKG